MKRIRGSEPLRRGPFEHPPYSAMTDDTATPRPAVDTMASASSGAGQTTRRDAQPPATGLRVVLEHVLLHHGPCQMARAALDALATPGTLDVETLHGEVFNTIGGNRLTIAIEIDGDPDDSGVIWERWGHQRVEVRLRSHE